MVNGEGFLIINREQITEDIENFEYTPKPEYQSTFKVFNEKNEKECIKRFFAEVLKFKPHC